MSCFQGTCKGRAVEVVSHHVPTLIRLEPHQRYRFYLKAAPPGRPGEYVGILEGSFYGNAAVERLADNEPDDGMPLLRARAEQLASEYVKKVRPGYAAEKADRTLYYQAGNDTAPRWKVSFWSQAPLTYPSFTDDAEVRVCPCGEIDRDSWVGAGLPRPPGNTPRKFRGKRVRMTVELKINRSGHKVPSGEISIFRGQVTDASGTTIKGSFFKEGRSDPPQAMRVLTKNIDSIQALENPPK